VNIRNQLICAWSVLVFMVLLGVGFGLLGRYIPPTPPTHSAAQVAHFYQHHTNLIRLGLVLTMVGAAFLAPWVAVLGHQMRRIEGSSAVLAQTQMLSGAMVILLIIIPTMLWTAAAFRPERDPQLVLLLNDVGWFFFILAFSLPMVQMLAIAIAVLGAPDSAVFPRWMGYLNLWLAILLLPGALVAFLKTGVFAWNGLIGWWLTIIDFGVFWTVNSVLLFRAIAQEAGRPQPILSNSISSPS
jgi:hypothetical protein